MTLEELLAKLENVTRTGAGFMARCPAHDDQNPSLSVTEKDAKILVHCHAGCTLEQIADALGLKPSDFFADSKKSPGKKKARGGVTLEELAEAKKLPVQFLKDTFRLANGHHHGRPAVIMPYYHPYQTNEVLLYRVRIKLHGDKKVMSKSGDRVALYGLDNLAAIKAAGWVLIVEGESDVWTCRYHRIPVLGVPGKGAWNAATRGFLDIFDGLEIFVWEEPNAETFSASIAKSLSEIKVIRAQEYKDISDAHIAGVDIADYIEKQKAGAKVWGPPSTRDLIYSIHNFIDRFVFFRDSRTALFIAVWTLATYIYETFVYFGMLWINSPTLRCGKTRLVEILDKLVYKSSGMNVNVTPAALFRTTAEGCTFLADEIENLKNSDKDQFGAVMSILNAGFQKGATVPRMEKNDGGWIVKKYDVYGPKVLAGISTVTDTIRDRSFSIQMTRQSKSEKKERLKLRKQKSTINDICADARAWAQQTAKAIQDIYDEMLEDPRLQDCDDRFIDIVEPLIALAKFADAESANGSKRVIDEIMPVIKDLGGKRDEAQTDEAIAALCVLLDDILGGANEVFVLSADLLSKAKETDGLTWIHSAKSLSNLMRKLGVYAGRDPAGKKRGYKLTKEAVDDIKLRYASHSDFEASEASDAQEDPVLN